MTTNFIISENINTFNDYRIVDISATTLRSFYEELADDLEFPDYFGFNLDSLDECLSDLSWIEEKKILIFINDSANFLQTERNPEKLGTLLDMLDALCEDWAWAEEGEEIPKKELKVAFRENDRIKQVLEDLEIPFTVQ